MKTSDEPGGRSGFSRQLLSVWGIVVACLLVMWPALLNGYPFLMADTSAYVRGADAAAFKITGSGTYWTGEFKRKFEAPIREQSSKPQADAPPNAEDPLILSGRSIYYGFALFLADRTVGFWLIAVLQALLCAISAVLTIRNLQEDLWHERGPAAYSAVLVGILAVVTPIGFFAGYLLPDIFSALGLLATANLAFFQLKRGQPVFWWLLLVAALLSHSATLLIVATLWLVLGWVAVMSLFQIQRRGLMLVGVGILLAVAGEAAFSFGVKSATGEAPVRPPFIAARIITDGPGYDYLVEHCPKRGLSYCRFAAGPRPLSSDILLWSPDRPDGAFMALKPSEARSLANDQNRFVWEVLKDRPIDVARSSLGAVLLQMSLLRLPEFNYSNEARQGFEAKLPASVLQAVRGSAAFRGSMPVGFVEAATPIVTVLALLIIFWRLHKLGRAGAARSRAAGFLIVICLGVALNAVICGALSTPHDRYLMRMIWLLPLVAAGVLFRIHRWSGTTMFSRAGNSQA